MMVLLVTILAFSFAVAFQGQYLTERYLQEKGVSAYRTFALHRWALIPALIWSAVFIRPADIDNLLQAPLLVFFLAFIAVFWNVQQFLSSKLANTVNSMSSLSTLRYMIYLPLLMFVGTYFNHDAPNFYSLAALGVLLLAFLLQPSPHAANLRNRFSVPLALIIGLAVLQAILDAINQGMYRELLKEIRPEVIIGVFSVMTLGLTAIWTAFMPKDPKDTAVLRRRWRRALLVPALWFIATVPEAYVYAEVSIYVGGAMMAITFIMDTVSDVIHHRIRLGIRTSAFISLVLAGIGLVIYSIS